MSSFNNARYAVGTLESLRQQSYPNTEIVVVDDCSTDDSVQVIEQWLASCTIPHRFIRHEKNMGVCRVANDLILNARGAYISIIASDDLMHPDKISSQVPLLEAASAEVGILYSDLDKIDADGNAIASSLYAVGELNHFTGNVWLELLKVNFLGGMTALTRRECFEKVGLFDETLAYEDWDMWLRIAREFKFLYQPKATCHYRVHSSSTTYTRIRQMNESSCLLLQKQLGVSPEGDAIINEHLAKYSETLYFLESPRSTYWLRERWRHRKDPRGFLLLAFSSLRVPSAWVSAVLRVARGNNS